MVQAVPAFAFLNENQYPGHDYVHSFLAHRDFLDPLPHPDQPNSSSHTATHNSEQWSIHLAPDLLLLHNVSNSLHYGFQHTIYIGG